MGIKGVYGEIGPGTRTALLKLAVEKKEQEKRNLRIAIDFSIWQHQVQLGKGGTNADLRTLFYRSLRLLRLSIEPLFVFDGPHKPPFKRNKKTSQSGGSAFQSAAVELFKLLGFPYITAPGEAEAECALLQKEGLVDAVLSEDVDTLMFGCTMHLRSWGAEDPKGKGTATHVDVYNANEIKQGGSGLDREGMILIALMSGGDYLPAGIPNCGIKIACEAARAGFGSDLLKTDRKDSIAIRAWRDRLEHELQTNESKFFRTKHKTLQIPENFPDKAVLYYYTNPVVSTPEQIQRYRRQLEWREPNIPEFWQASKKFFDWQGSEGLRHFIRNLAPVLVGWRLANGVHASKSHDEAAEQQLVKTVTARRLHASAGGVSELRVAYIPQAVVGLNLQEAVESAITEVPTHTALYNAEEEAEDLERASNDAELTGPASKRVSAIYDPAKIEKDWFPEAYVKIGAPITVGTWEAEQNDPKKFASRKARARQKEKEAMPQGAIEKYFTSSNPATEVQKASNMSLVKCAQVPAAKDVSSNPQTSLVDSLTNLVTPISSASPSMRQTIQRSKPAIAKAVKTTAKVNGYGRVTKPISQVNVLKPSVTGGKDNYGEEVLDWNQIPTQLATSCKHARSPSPTGIILDLDNEKPAMNGAQLNEYSDKRHKKPISNSLAASKARPTRKATLDESLLSFDSKPMEILGNIENDQLSALGIDVSKPIKHRSPFTRTISAPNQQALLTVRPTYNPWKSIDDFDTSLESLRTPAKKTLPVVDLTLS